MKSMFSGYYRPDTAELEKLWAEGTFVFDTNVLLDLYSYPEAVRDVFLSVLHKIGGRIWIPYQVGIEFHRNRFTRIKQSNQRVEKLLLMIQNTGKALSTEVNEIELEKRNIGISDIQDRLTAVHEAHKALSEVVQLACDRLPLVSLDDKIGNDIGILLDGKVGLPPTDQAALDALVADGLERYEKKIPPGFADVAAKGDDVFRDRGITYQRKFGDLILWRQLLAHTKEMQLNAVIFVTGDKKKDWWWSDDGKTLGPLPELVQEIHLESNVELFWMYSADQFLQNAENFLKATEVTAETVEQVKELSAKDSWLSNETLDIGIARYIANVGIPAGSHELFSESSSVQTPYEIREFRRGITRGNPEPPDPRFLLRQYSEVRVEDAVERWLINQHKGCEVLRSKSFPDFIVSGPERASGFEIKNVRGINPRAFPPGVVHSLLRGYLEVNEGRLIDFSLVIVLPDDGLIQLTDRNWQDEMMHRGAALLNKYPAHSIIVGVVLDDTFEPYLMITSNP